MEGMLKVIIWRLDGTISQQEFSQIYKEWLKKKGVEAQVANTRNFFLCQIVPVRKDITNESSYFNFYNSLCKELGGLNV
jgi:hypothetical protein